MSCCSKFRKGRERKEGEYECEKERKVRSSGKIRKIVGGGGGGQ